MREIPALAVYMTSYTAMRRLFTPEGHRHPSIFLDLIAGGTAGIASWITTVPLDVLKTRIQSDDLANRRYTGGIRHCLVFSWLTDGARVFWRGLGATCLRAFPANAVTLIVYSKTLAFLQDSATELTHAKTHRDETGSRPPVHRQSHGLDAMLTSTATTIPALSAKATGHILD
jgi:hypothetical protein